MDTTTVERLTRLAPYLQKFLQLHPYEQDWLILIMGRAERRAIAFAKRVPCTQRSVGIAILECIEGNSLSYKEIAEITDSNINTDKQTI